MGKRCKWCAAGHTPENGEHWIVKGIGKIDIKPCADAAKAVRKGQP